MEKPTLIERVTPMGMIAEDGYCRPQAMGPIGGRTCERQLSSPK